MKSLPTVVIGAGITGLSAAWHLQRQGHAVLVLEASGHPGGAIQTLREEGYVVEMGPNTLMVDEPGIAQFLEEALSPESIQYANSEANKRFIVRDDKPHAIPSSPLRALTTKLWPKTAMLRVLKELFLPAYAGEKEESLADFVRRRLGQTMLDYAINPFVAGVYAGDPETLSVKYAFPKLYNLEQDFGGSLIRGSLKLKKQRAKAGKNHKASMISFPQGLSYLPETLAARMQQPIRFQTTATAVQKQSDGTYQVQIQTGGETSVLEARSVVLALPAPALTQIELGGGIQNDLSLLQEIEYPPVTSVAMAFPRGAVQHPLDGFGMLVPEVEKREILGTLFSSTLFPGRAPEDQVLLTTFIGGTRQPENAGLKDAEITALTLKELRSLLGVQGDPVFTSIRRWPRAIPQYKIGYGKYLEAMDNFESANPGLFIAGHIRDGISLAKCIRGGIRVSEAVSAFSSSGN